MVDEDCQRDEERQADCGGEEFYSSARTFCGTDAGEKHPEDLKVGPGAEADAVEVS